MFSYSIALLPVVTHSDLYYVFIFYRMVTCSDTLRPVLCTMYSYSIVLQPVVTYSDLYYVFVFYRIITCSGILKAVEHFSIDVL